MDLIQIQKPITMFDDYNFVLKYILFFTIDISKCYNFNNIDFSKKNCFFFFNVRIS